MEVLPGPLPNGRRSGGDEGLGSRLCEPVSLLSCQRVCLSCQVLFTDIPLFFLFIAQEGVENLFSQYTTVRKVAMCKSKDGSSAFR